MMKAGFVILLEGYDRSADRPSDQMFMTNSHRFVYAKKSLALDAVKRLATGNPGQRYYVAELRYSMIVPAAPVLEECGRVD
jgi:hypothetical protein